MCGNKFYIKRQTFTASVPFASKECADLLEDVAIGVCKRDLVDAVKKHLSEYKGYTEGEEFTFRATPARFRVSRSTEWDTNKEVVTVAVKYYVGIITPEYAKPDYISEWYPRMLKKMNYDDIQERRIVFPDITDKKCIYKPYEFPEIKADRADEV